MEQMTCLTTDDRLVSLDVDTEEPSSVNYVTFELIDHDDYGGTYVTKDSSIEIKKIWLCNVAHFFFDGEHPETINILNL